MPDTTSIRPTALTATDLSHSNVRHGFFTRIGGASQGIYAGLNAGLGSDDTRETVVANRAAVATQLGVPPSHLVSPHQVHSADVVAIAAPWGEDKDRPRADALVTATPGLAVAIVTADCTPVLFADHDAGVVAAAHAGWRGARDGVLEATLTSMESVGATRARITAVVGPCISGANYEVGHEFQQQLISVDSDAADFFILPTPESRPHFDLPAYCRHRLAKAGCAVSDEGFPCTYADETQFFSYRRTTHRSEPDYGRQISAICLT